MVIRTSALVAILILIASPPAVIAQHGVTDIAPTKALPSRCAAIAARAPVSAEARLAAQGLAGRAQSSSINGDNAAATELYRKAAALDPTDAGIAYALGRDYEAMRDARAMAEYCRFLALTPQAVEAPDVRQRIAALALSLPPDTTVVRIPVAGPARMPAPGAALISGLIVPGLGQFTTHQPTAGLLVMAASAAAVVYGLQTQTVTSQVTRTAIDPLGHAYQYPATETHSERPHAAVGIGAAAAISLVAALNAYSLARAGHREARDMGSASGTGSRVPRSATPVLTIAQRSIGLGLSLR